MKFDSPALQEIKQWWIEEFERRFGFNPYTIKENSNNNTQIQKGDA